MARYSESTSPDSTISPMFPDRPIHPLPKRRLRERLSPEVADSIEYPPTPPTTVLYYPYKEEEYDTLNGGLQQRQTTPNGDDDDPSRTRRSQAVPRSAPSIRSIPLRLAQKQEQPRYGSQPSPSAASSVDGYDTFENTNNKKKRKVPDTALGHSINDLGAGQLSPSTPVRVIHPDSCDASCGSYHGLGSASPGLSGPGRGRFGRNRSGRSPLSESNRNSKMRPVVRWSPMSTPTTGIISNAISKVEKLGTPSRQGQENVSLLELQRISNPIPGSGQFTFTCDSRVPGTVSWPEPHGKPGSTAALASRHDASSQPTRPPWPGGASAEHVGSTPAASRQMAGPPPGTQAAPAAKPRRRRTKADEYAKAARDRQNQKQHDKYRGIQDEEHWLCLFCEYEDLFGQKPMALIRAYEKKDRQRRKEEAERRRLLEKAKARGRKGKKMAATAKAPSKGSHEPAGHDYHGHNPHDAAGGLHHHHHDHHTCGQHNSHHHHQCDGDHSINCDGPHHHHHHHHEYEDHHDFHEHLEYGDHYDGSLSPDGDGHEGLDSKSSGSSECELHKRTTAVGGTAGARPGQNRPPDLVNVSGTSRNGPPPVRV